MTEEPQSDLLADACIDMIPDAPAPSDAPDGAAGLILPTHKMWDPGRVLDFHFLNGTDDQKQSFRSAAAEWTEYANLLMRFDASPSEAEFRVGFGFVGNWSYVGTDNLSRPAGSKTMAIQDISSIPHEVGHALGCAHEHSSPAGTIEWNKPVVYQALGGPPNNWKKERVDHNVFRKYAGDTTQFSAFDPKSIMLYFFPDSWTLDGKGTKENEILSDTDKAFINRCYPGCTADFSKPEIKSGNCKVTTGPGTFFNKYKGNSWLMHQPNASFVEVVFNQPTHYDGQAIYTAAKLRLVHLTSMNGPAPGHSPVDIIFNGTVIAENYSPASGRYISEEWDVMTHMNDGENSVRINFKDGSTGTDATNYWIQKLEVDCRRAYLG